MIEEKNQTVLQEDESQGLDYKAIALRLWDKRVFILKVFCCFAAFGLVKALFISPVYTAKCTFIAQSSSKTVSSQWSTMAQMAGLNLNDMTSSQTLSPLIYPEMMQNVEFKKELIRIPLHFRKFPEPVSFYDKATDPQYRQFNLMGIIRKYTIGLPGTIIGALSRVLNGKPEGTAAATGNSGSSSSSSISTLTPAEYACSQAVNSMVSLSFEKNKGYMILTATMGEPLAAAELCQAVFDLLQKYVTDFKLQNARLSESYIKERYKEAMADYKEKQLILAQFSDTNRGIPTATAQTRRDQLMADYQLSYALFTEISKQLLQAQMKIREDTPILSVVEPVCVPMTKSNSRSKTLFSWIFLGILVSCGSVLGIDWARSQGLKWPENWD